MRGATLCSGIGAPECASPDIDWIWSAEIEPFPSAVHGQRFPGSVNLGDMTAPDFVERAAAVGLPDLLVAGTPCQAFSFAGLRRSLDDDRGNLTLRFVGICDAIDDLRRARGLPGLNVLWENVPGVLSTRDNAFGCFLGAAVGADSPLVPPRGLKWTDAGMVVGPRRSAAWRILDAQYFGVAQRRERVFVVLCPGGGADPAAILFECEGVRRDSTPRREAGAPVAALTARGVGTCGADDNQAQAGHLVPVAGAIAPTLNAAFGKKLGLDNQHIDNGGGLFVVHALQDPITSTGVSLPLGAKDRGHAVAFSCKDHGQDAGIEVSPTLRSMNSSGPETRNGGGQVAALIGSAVRRLTPTECEALQGFPRGWTDIRYRGKPAVDGPRYKAIGNSMAVPVMAWILDRLRAAVERSWRAAA